MCLECLSCYHNQSPARTWPTETTENVRSFDSFSQLNRQCKTQWKELFDFLEKDMKTIVNRGNWLGSPANIKETNKDAKIYVERSTTLHNLLFSPHTLCMNYVTNTFLLVSSSVQSKQLLCFVQGQKNRTITYNKELWRVS